MAKLGILKNKTVKVTGVLNSEDNVIEVEGENLSIEDLLKEFDGYQIQLILTQEYSNENPTNEDIKNLGKFEK